MTQPTHIFIMGLNRTGTNLLQRILNSSADVAISGETHYLKHWIGYQGFQRELAGIADISTDSEVQQVVDYIYRIRSNFWRGKNFWSWIQQNVDRQEFLQKLLASDRSDHAVLDVVMAVYAAGKPIHGEKTPAHIHSVPTLLEWYPQAKMIHTFRDPRAIFASEKRRQFMEYVTLPYRILGRSKPVLELFLSSYIIITWLRLIRLHHQYQRRFPNNYRLCRYEDLVNDPETCLRELCTWLEIDFNRAMLQHTFQNSSLVPRHQAKGIDSSAIDRWRKHLHPLTNKWMTLWSKKELLELGYPL